MNVNEDILSGTTERDVPVYGKINILTPDY
jgi:hypothetical protein